MANTPAQSSITDDISAINPSKDTWSMVATPIRLWVVPSFSGSKLPYSMELVLMDSKGCKIHASVKKSLIYKFQPLLNDGRVYHIAFFGVEQSSGEFRTTAHPCKINFQYSTTVRLVTDVPINRSPYSFKTLTDVSFNNTDPAYLIDVIGILTGASEGLEFEKDGKKNKKITIQIEQNGVQMECAFFGDYVAEVLGQLAAGDKTNAVVVIQFAKIKPFRGKISLQNAYGSTRVLFNPDVEGADLLKKRFFEVHDRTAQVLDRLPDSGKVSVSDDFLKRHWGKTIEKIKELTKKTTCIMLGTIKSFIEGSEWWYPACKCTKKVYPEDGMYFCESCNRHVLSTNPRFKLQACVMDEKDTATFVIFDQEASALLNTSCADLVDASSKNHGESMLPPQIMTLINRTFLFKFEVDNRPNSRFEPSYRVKKICADPQIISNFLAANPPSAAGPYILLTAPTSNNKAASSSSDLAKDLKNETDIAGNSNETEVSSAKSATKDKGKVTDIAGNSNETEASSAKSATKDKGKMAEVVDVENLPSGVGSVGDDSTGSLPVKRPSPPEVEAGGGKKLFKEVKKEKI